MNYLNNHILLLLCHLIITRQTQPSLKNIRPDIGGTVSTYIRITPTSPIPISGHKPMHPINRLHMHRLPNRPSFRIE